MQKGGDESFDEYFPESLNIPNERTRSPLRWDRTQSQRTQSPLRWERTQSQRTRSPLRLEQRPQSPLHLEQRAQSPLRWEQRAQSPLSNHDPPKTTAFRGRNEKESDADQFLFQNIRSFSRRICEEEMSKIGRDSSPIRSRSNETPPRSSSRSTETPQRSPSLSSRVFIREDDAPLTPTSDDSTAEEDDSITVLTYSKSPYDDFRQSMQEMVEARVASNGVVDRQFMEELLFRYLDLNNEKYYGCIVRAFLDLIVISREDSPRFPDSRRFPDSPRFPDSVRFPARRRPWIGGRRKLKLEIKRMRKFCENSPFVPKFVPK